MMSNVRLEKFILPLALAGMFGCRVLLPYSPPSEHPNDIRQVQPEHWIGRDPSRATLVYGIADRARWPHDEFEINLDRYSIERDERIGSDCNRYDHASASVPSGTRDLRYAVFDAPAGYYAYS